MPKGGRVIFNPKIYVLDFYKRSEEVWGARLDKVSIHVRSVVTRKHGFVEGVVADDLSPT